MASGADVTCVGSYAIKTGQGEIARRLNEQAEWLIRHRSVGLPKVWAVMPSGYAMERLEQPIEPVTAKSVLELLKRHVWCHPAEVTVHWGEHMHYGRARATWLPSEYCNAFVDSYGQIVHKSLTVCLTHGDPTFENVMRQPSWSGMATGRRGSYVLIDPIPARSYAPDLQALDLGKIIQSSLGYEWIVRGGESPEEPNLAWLFDFPYEEQVAAWHFALFHLARLMPYLPDDETRERMVDQLGKPLLNLRP